MKIFLTKVLFNSKPKFAKYSILKIIICVILYIITIDKLIIFNFSTIILRIPIILIFFLSVFELYILYERKRNSKRTIDDYFRIDDVNINIISEYLFKTNYTRLVILIGDDIVDIGCEPIKKRYLPNTDITKKYFYINENKYYYSIGFEIFNKELNKLSTKEKITLLINKTHSFEDEKFLKYFYNNFK